MEGGRRNGGGGEGIGVFSLGGEEGRRIGERSRGEKWEIEERWYLVMQVLKILALDRASS